MDGSAEERPRFWGRVAGLFYVLNIISGSLALVFIRRKLVLYTDAANFTATISYVIVTVLFYSIFRPASRRVSLIIIGGLSWLTFLSRSLANALTPYNMAPGILAETLPTLWLLIPGINAQRWKEQAATAR
jgi:hypothetical protein